MNNFTIHRNGKVIGLGHVMEEQRTGALIVRALLDQKTVGYRAWMHLQEYLSGICFDGDESQFYECVSIIGSGMTEHTIIIDRYFYSAI